MAESSNDDIKTLMEISGLEKEGAERFLRLKNNNLQEAIHFYLDGGTLEELIALTNSSKNAATDNPTFFAEPEEEVRAPIPKKQEILLPPEEHLHGNNYYRLRQNHRQTINPFRNFAYESENTEWNAKRSRLEDLFRPPIDLICPGSFNVVKDYARTKNRWLLINVQDDSEFISQILYRDIWSNTKLKGFIKSNLVFWQTGKDTMEGQKIKVYYNAQEFPYVALIDPRTGEEMQGYRGQFPYTAEQFLDSLDKFVAEHGTAPEKDEEDPLPPSAPSADDEPTASTSNHQPTPNKTSRKRKEDSEASGSRRKRPATEVPSKSVVNLTEEEQLELALKQSIEETCFRDSKSSSQSPPPELSSDESSDFEEPAEAEENVDDESVKKFMEPAKTEGEKDEEINENGPKTRLMIKLPEGTTEIINWPAEAKIRGLKRHLNDRYDTQKRDLKSFCPTIRKDLQELNEQFTLIQAQLHPSCVIHLHANN